MAELPRQNSSKVIQKAGLQVVHARKPLLATEADLLTDQVLEHILGIKAEFMAFFFMPERSHPKPAEQSGESRWYNSPFWSLVTPFPAKGLLPFAFTAHNMEPRAIILLWAGPFWGNRGDAVRHLDTLPDKRRETDRSVPGSELVQRICHEQLTQLVVLPCGLTWGAPQNTMIFQRGSPFFFLSDVGL